MDDDHDSSDSNLANISLKCAKAVPKPLSTSIVQPHTHLCLEEIAAAMMVSDEEQASITKQSDQGGGRYAKDQRALLFGSRFGKRNEINVKGQAAAKAYASVQLAAMEEQNQDLTESLQTKVEELKEVSMGIKSEVAQSLQATEDLSGALDRARGLLSRNTQRLQGMVKGTGSSLHVCYIVLFAIALFLAFYLIGVCGGGAGGRSVAGSFLAPSRLSGP